MRIPEEGSRLLHAAWTDDGFRDAVQSARWRDRAGEWVEAYLRPVSARREPVGVERTVAATTATLAVTGRVDRIDDRDGELVVVDYKTGRRPLDETDARRSPALALYVLGVRRTLRRPCRRVELHHLPTGTVAAFEHTEHTLGEHVRRAEATAAGIRAATADLDAGAQVDEAFPPAPGPGCSWCDFRTRCPEGRAAAPDRESWAGLGEEQAAG